MTAIRRFLSGLIGALKRNQVEQDLDDELRAFLETAVEHKVRAGMSRNQAMRAARLELGSEASVKDAVRDAGWDGWLDSVGRDISQAWRSFWRSPGFTCIAVLTVGIGIGATSAIFSVVNGVLLTPLPYNESERVVRLFMNAPASESPLKRPLRGALPLNVSEIDEVRARVDSFDHAGTASGFLRALRGHEEAARLLGARVSSSIFEMVEARPALGRSFTAADELAAANPVVILSDGTWRRFYNADPGIIGTDIIMDSVLGARVEYRSTVIGVMPPSFAFPDQQTALWVPFQAVAPGAAPLRGPLVARLAPGVSVEAATAEITSVMRGLRPEMRETTYELSFEQGELVEPVRPALLVLIAAVGCLLLIACVNVANLSLARGAARQREMAVRVAIGAGRGRLIRQMLTESLMLAIAGGVVGVGLAVAGVRILRQLATTIARIDLAPAAFPRIDGIGIDPTVLLFTVACSLITGLLFGLAPALLYSQVDPVTGLRAAGTGSRRRSSAVWPTLRQSLVIAEVALAMVLLVGGGLLVRSFTRLSAIDPGYDAANVLTFQVSLPMTTYTNPRQREFAESLVERLRSVPGIDAAGYGNQLPMVNLTDTAGGLWPTADPKRAPTPLGPEARFVSRDYLRVFGVSVRTGRGLNEGDGEGQPRVLLVNQALVQTEFNGENPVGRQMYVGRDVMPWEIVGIVDDVRQAGLDRAPTSQFFADLRQWSGTGTFFPAGAYYAVRATGDPQALTAKVRAIVSELDREAALFNVAPMAALVANSVARPRLYAVLLGTFAIAGLLLALIGIYGVMAYSVTQRTREIGIRMSLGARRGIVMRLVLQQGSTLTLIGIVIGLAGAVAMTRFLETLLFGLTALDTGTFVAVTVVFLAASTLASYLPARRATKVDPLAALRCE